MPDSSNNTNNKSISNISNKKAKTINNSNNNNNNNSIMSDHDKQQEKMNEEFRIVRAYILACPHVSSSASDHPAIKAALNGLDQERKRLERDAKLQKKFSGTATTTGESSLSSFSTGNKNADMEAAVMVANPSTTMMSTTERATTAKHDDADDDQTDDWQDLAAVRSEDDVLMETGDGGDDENSNKHHGAAAHASADYSFLGDRLSAEVIRIIAQQHSVTVQTPLAAIAVALHAAMRSTILGFACTGIPEDEKSSSAGGGFAPPVRELPATQLLPPNWETAKNGDSSSIISLRYRKKGTGSVVLHVSATNNNSNNNNNHAAAATTTTTTMVQVTLIPSAAPEPPSESLSFALSDHVNLDSFARAAATSSRQVPPALHYKALSSLLTKFCTTFDLGSVHDGDDDNNMNSADKNMPYVDTSIQHYPVIVPQIMAIGNGSYMTHPPQPSPKFGDEPPPPQQFPPMICNPRDPRLDPPTIESAFPALRHPSRNGSGGGGGDFDMDKGLPGMGAGVLPNGGGFLGDPMHGGNLMGPNHPMFTGAGGVGGGGGGHSSNFLVPRYDPVFGPPGGPGDVQDPNNPLNQLRPRGGGGPPIKPNFSGNPNPDHFPPPGGCGGGGGGHDMFS